MPFQSEKQRRYLHANHPEIAKRWERDYATGGISNHFRKKYSLGEGPVMEDTESTDFISSLTQEQVDDDPERYAQLLIGLRKPDFFMGEGDNQRAYFIQSDNSRISVPWGFRGYGLSYEPTIDFKKGGIANHFKLKDGGNIRLGPHKATDLLVKKTSTGERPKYQPPGGGETSLGSGAAHSGGASDRGPRDAPDRHGPTTETKTTTGPGPDPHGGDWTPGWLDDATRKGELKKLAIIGDEDNVKVPTSKDIHDNILDKHAHRFKSLKDLTLDQKARWAKDKYEDFKTAKGFMSIAAGPFGWLSAGKAVLDANKRKKETITELKKDIKTLTDLGYPTHHHSVDTLIQSLNQEILDMTQPKDQKDTGGDGPPEIPVTIPVVMDEMADATGQIDMFDAWGNIKQKQALRASLFADEDQAKVGEWVGDQRLLVNSGGLANLFRVKNQ